MPVIDISQSSYRTLVKAAHQRGLSIDRFIERHIAPDSGSMKANGTIGADEITDAGRTEAPHRGPAGSIPPVSDPTAEIERQQAPSGANGGESGFETLWSNIERTAGRAISTKRGQDFTYVVESDYLTVCETGTRVPKSQFKKALEQWPVAGPSKMRGVYAASVVWAVLADLALREEIAWPADQLIPGRAA